MKLNLKKITSATIALLPWLGNYSFLIDKLTLGDFILLMVFLINVFSNRRLFISNFKNPQKYLLIFYIYGFIIVCLSFLSNSIFVNSLVINRTIKLGFYIIIIFFMITPELTDFGYFTKYYRIIVYVSCAAILMQYLAFYLGGIYLEFKLPFLTYSSDFAEQFDYTASRLSSFRPDSIFLEPAHFVYYVIGYLPICLFKKYNGKPNIIEATLVTLCILMSVSSTGVFYLISIWCYFLFAFLLKSKISLYKKISTMFIVLIISYAIITIFINTELYTAIARLGRVNSVGAIEYSNAWDKLILGSEYLFELNDLERIFGIGFGNYRTGIFTTSIYFIIYSTGIIGGVFFLLWILNHYINSNNLGKSMIILTLLLFSSWYLVYSSFFVLFNILILNYCYLPYSREI